MGRKRPGPPPLPEFSVAKIPASGLLICSSACDKKLAEKARPIIPGALDRRSPTGAVACFDSTARSSVGFGARQPVCLGKPLGLLVLHDPHPTGSGNLGVA